MQSEKTLLPDQVNAPLQIFSEDLGSLGENVLATAHSPGALIEKGNLFLMLHTLTRPWLNIVIKHIGPNKWCLKVRKIVGALLRIGNEV